MHTSTPAPPTHVVPFGGVGLGLGLGLSELAQAPSVALALAAVREQLGMDVAYVSEIVGADMTIRAVDGDAPTFFVTEGLVQPAERTYCQRMLAGRLPNMITDVRGDDRAASLPTTQIADVGAFTTVALRFSDGRLYGTLCAASHRAMPELGYRELQFLHVVARIVADQLERTELKNLVRTHVMAEHDLLGRTAELRTGALDLLETVSDERPKTSDSALLVNHLQGVANDLGTAERMLLTAA